MPGRQEIKDRAAMTDHVVDVMHQLCPSWSVDTLNAHPFDAIRVYTEAARRAHLITNAKARAIFKWLDAGPHIIGDERSAKEAIHRMARTALSSRKRGDLKMDRY